MILTKNELIKYALNSTNYKEEEECISFLRFTDSQLQVYAESPMFRAMSLCSAGICLSFDTTGSEVSFECRTERIIRAIKPASDEETDQPVDSTPVVNTLKVLGQYAKYMLEAGVMPDIKQYFDLYTDGNYLKSVRVKNGRIVFSFDNDDHKWVNIKIWFPLFTQVSIRNVSINGQHRPAVNTAPLVVYCFGDSITQGFMVGKPSFGYVEALSVLLNANALNQGVSGYFYNPEILVDFENIPSPDMVTVAYGTNEWFLNCGIDEIERKITCFYARLHELYPHIPVFAITPIWRKDMDKQMESGSLHDVAALIKKIAGQYENVNIIDGMRISPHCPKLYEDGFLHPGIAGNAYMTPRIYKEIITKLDLSGALKPIESNS